MTNQLGNHEIKFSGEPMTPEQREHDRWHTMARYSLAMMTAGSADERMAYMETILDKFRDVPNQQPDRENTAAYARFAVRMFLEALITSEGKVSSVAAENVHSVATENVHSVATENVHSVATENVFNEWIDAWLPPSHAARMTQARM